jgi:hypothetical protein
MQRPSELGPVRTPPRPNPGKHLAESNQARAHPSDCAGNQRLHSQTSDAIFSYVQLELDDIARVGVGHEFV